MNISIVLSIIMLYTSTNAQSEIESLSKELRCMVCQGQSIADSDAAFARDIRAFIIEKKAQAWTDIAIKDYLTTKFGEEMQLTPKTSHWGLWLLPYITLSFTLCSAAYRYILIRKNN